MKNLLILLLNAVLWAIWVMLIQNRNRISITICIMTGIGVLVTLLSVRYWLAKTTKDQDTVSPVGFLICIVSAVFLLLFLENFKTYGSFEAGLGMVFSGFFSFGGLTWWLFLPTKGGKKMNPVTRVWNRIPRIPFFWDAGGDFWIMIVGGVGIVSVFVANYIVGYRLPSLWVIIIGGGSGLIATLIMERWREPLYWKNHKDTLWLMLILGCIWGAFSALATSSLFFT